MTDEGVIYREVSMIAEAVASGAYDHMWEIIASVVSTVLLPMLVLYLQDKRKEAQARTLAEGLKAKQILAERVKSYIYGTAANYAEKGIPKLMAAIKEGKIKDVETTKRVLRSWGKQLRDSSVTYFNEQGFDLAKEFGDKWLANVIERAANEKNPFPGKPTAQALIDCCGGPGPCDLCPNKPEE